MGILLTTGQVADELTALLTNTDGSPTITAAKVLAQVEARLLTDVGPGKQVRVDRDEVVALAGRTHYVADPSVIADLILRVSVIELRRNDCYSLQGNRLRTDAGVDYSRPGYLGGIEGVWKVGVDNADRLVDEEGLLLATCKGYVHPEHVRTIKNWEHVVGTSRRYFHTDRAPKKVRKTVGTGIWIDVPPGRESGILVG